MCDKQTFAIFMSCIVYACLCAGAKNDQDFSSGIKRNITVF